VVLAVLAVPQIMAIAQAIARPVMAGRVVEALAGIAHLAELAGITTVLGQLTLEALAAMALVEVLVEAVVARGGQLLWFSMVAIKVVTVAALASKAPEQVELAGQVAYLAALPMVAWEQADHLEQLGQLLSLGNMVVVLAAVTMDMPTKKSRQQKIGRHWAM
jgi:hypothetical protein